MATSRIPFSVSQTTLPDQNIKRNQPGMNNGLARMGPNAYDGFSNVAYEVQPLNNAMFENQSQRQNLTTAASQAAAGAMDNVRSASAAEANAQNLLRTRTSEAIYANMDLEGNPSSTGMMGQMGNEQLTGIKRRVAIGKAQSLGMNPDLGDYQGSVQQYS